MSATAYQRRRRLARIKALRQEAEKQNEVDYNNLSKEELKVILDEKGIKYDAKAKKEDLIKLLEGAE